MLDFLFSDGGLEQTSKEGPKVTGGGVRSTLLETFDRDGYPYEGSVHYNTMVQSALQNIAQLLNDYPPFKKNVGTKSKWIDLTQNEIYKQMFLRQEPLVFLDSSVPRLGDTKGSGKPGFGAMMDTDALLAAYRSYGGTELAQWIHLRNGKSTDGLRGSIFDPEPTAVGTEIERLIEKNGELAIESRQLAGFGFTALRPSGKGTGRGVWTYYGRNGYGPEQGYGTSTATGTR